MRTYADSLLERKIVGLSQELKSLKTSQKYLTGQTMGYESSKVRINSRILQQHGGYTQWAIYCRIKFTGDNLGTAAIAKPRYQLYDKNGNKIYVETEEIDAYNPYDKVYTDFKGLCLSGFPGDAPNVYYTELYFYLVTESSGNSNFYGDFWFVSNDNGIATKGRDFNYAN